MNLTTIPPPKKKLLSNDSVLSKFLKKNVDGKESKTSTITSKNKDANNHKPLEKEVTNNLNDDKNDMEIKKELK